MVCMAPCVKSTRSAEGCSHVAAVHCCTDQYSHDTEEQYHSAAISLRHLSERASAAPTGTAALRLKVLPPGTAAARFVPASLADAAAAAVAPAASLVAATARRAASWRCCCCCFCGAGLACQTQCAQGTYESALVNGRWIANLSQL